MTMENTTVDKELVRFNNAGAVTITGCELLAGLKVEGSTTVTLTDCKLTNVGSTDTGRYKPIEVSGGRVIIISGTYSFDPAHTANVKLDSNSTAKQVDGVWVVTVNS